MPGDIKYKIIVREDYMMGEFDIYLFKESPAGRHMIYQDGHTQKEVLIEEGTYQVTPTLKLNKDLLQQLLGEIINRGIELPTKSKVEGLYEAQSFHLRDLRKLLKLDTEFLFTEDHPFTEKHIVNCDKCRAEGK